MYTFVAFSFTPYNTFPYFQTYENYHCGVEQLSAAVSASCFMTRVHGATRQLPGIVGIPKTQRAILELSQFSKHAESLNYISQIVVSHRSLLLCAGVVRITRFYRHHFFRVYMWFSRFCTRSLSIDQMKAFLIYLQTILYKHKIIITTPING